MQRKPDLGDRCKSSRDTSDTNFQGCNGNLTWAIVASKGNSKQLLLTAWVQRKPDLGDRCKTSGEYHCHAKLEVQRKPDLGDRCKFRW